MSHPQNRRFSATLLDIQQRLATPLARGVVLGSLWLLSVVIGVGLLWIHSQAPGRLYSPPAAWPVDSALPHQVGKPTLLLFAHPQCPCTIASIRELERLLAECRKPIDAVVVFDRPADVDDQWMRTSAWSLVEGIPGVTTFEDVDGVEAKRFAAATSGQACLYSSDGRLLFHGGITAARGHEGDSVGQSAILSLVDGRQAEACSPVYGCPLTTPPGTAPEAKP